VKLSTLLELDARWSNYLRVAERPGILRTLSTILAHSGDSWFWAMGLAIIYLIPNAHAKQWALTQLVWISILVVVVMALKFTIRRRRPEGEWGAIYRSTDPHSFPSGHAARSFLIAVIGVGFGPIWLGLLLLIWAFLVSLARVAMGVHYLSDVVAGAFIGIFVGSIGFYLSPALFNFIFGFTGPLW
jgi:membrane-associated phospholipid phosphatase